MAKLHFGLVALSRTDVNVHFDQPGAVGLVAEHRRLDHDLGSTTGTAAA